MLVMAYVTDNETSKRAWGSSRPIDRKPSSRQHHSEVKQAIVFSCHTWRVTIFSSVAYSNYIRMRTIYSLILVVALMIALVESFSTTKSCSAFLPPARVRSTRRHSKSMMLTMKVNDVTNAETFDSMITGAKEKGSLVIIDYSTTWCGPCKVIAPKFDELSDKYPQAVFIKVIGDASPEASVLMKREGVRSVPSFHYFKNGEKVDVVNGANAAAVEAAISKHL